MTREILGFEQQNWAKLSWKCGSKKYNGCEYPTHLTYSKRHRKDAWANNSFDDGGDSETQICLISFY